MNTDPTHPLDPPFHRPTYHDGMLLEAEDFIHEQEYHRKRLANAMLRLHGFGTVAGLRVTATAGEIVVEPGVAVDTRGRVLELTEKQCLRLPKWFDFVMSKAPPKVFKDGGKDFILADVYAHFVAKESGLRPAFPEAAADALDAVVPFRLKDSVKATMHAVPDPADLLGPDFTDTQAKPADRAALLEGVLAAYTPSHVVRATGKIGEGMKQKELAEGVFLARVAIPLIAGTTKHDISTPPDVKHDHRPLLPSAAFIFSRFTLNTL